jgi:hypothetical protein
MKRERLDSLMKEARELTAIFTASYETVRVKRQITGLPDCPITGSVRK